MSPWKAISRGLRLAGGAELHWRPFCAIFRLAAVRDARVLAIDYLYFRVVARQVIGVLWRALKSPRLREKLVSVWAGQGSALPDRLAAKLRRKNADWERLRLDPALVAQVQDRAVAECRELWRRHPELFP